MQHALDLNGKIVIITGGGKGVGLGITRSFLAHGATVLICGRSELDELPEVGGNRASFIAADVRDIEQLTRVIDHAMAQWGRLDVLVNKPKNFDLVDLDKLAPAEDRVYRFSCVEA